MADEWSDYEAGGDVWQDFEPASTYSGPTLFSDPMGALTSADWWLTRPSGERISAKEAITTPLSGLVTGPLKAGGAVADVLAYPFHEAKELYDGTPSTGFSTAIAQEVLPALQDLTGVDLTSKNKGRDIIEFIAPTSRRGIVGQTAAGLGAFGGSEIADVVAPNNPYLKLLLGGAGAVAGGKVQGGFSSASDLIKGYLDPETAGINLARSVAGDVQSVVPEAITAPLSMADRSRAAVSGLDASAVAERKRAGDLFRALPDEPVSLTPAIEAIKSKAEEVAGPIFPGSRTDQVLKFLEAKPDINAVPLNEVQNVVRDVGKIGARAEGVDALVMGNAKRQLLDAVQESVSPETMKAYTEARSAWRNMMESYEEGAVGAVRDSTDVGGKLNTFKNRLLNDPKGAEELAKVMSPDELKNAQHLMLADLFSFTPVSWARQIAKKQDSYKAIFGEDTTNNLMSMMSREGSVGRKLLADNQGLSGLLGKLAMRLAVPAGVVQQVVGGPLGTMAGIATGAFMAKKGVVEAAARPRAASIIARAAIGNPDALKLLQAPVKSKASYEAALSKLPILLGDAAQSNVVDAAMKRAEAKVMSKPETPKVVSAKRTPIPEKHLQTAEKVADAVISQESSGNANAVSKKGAIGLMQVLPTTAGDIAKELGEVSYDLKDPETNKRFGKYYLAKMLDQFDGDLELALTAYNQGPARVQRLVDKYGDSLDDIKIHLGPDGQKYARSIIRRLRKAGVLSV